MTCTARYFILFREQSEGVSTAVVDADFFFCYATTPTIYHDLHDGLAPVGRTVSRPITGTKDKDTFHIKKNWKKKENNEKNYLHPMATKSKKKKLIVNKSLKLVEPVTSQTAPICSVNSFPVHIRTVIGYR